MRKYLLLLLFLLSGCTFVDESPNRCYHLWDPSQKDNCLLMVATQTMNISKCDEINRTDIAQQCYSTLLMAAGTGNASVCSRMTGIRRDDCFLQLATSKNSTSMCMEINFSYQRDSCLSKIAVASDRPDICNPILNNASRDFCKNQIFADLAVKNKDASFCKLLIAENASNQDMVDTCIFTLAKKLNDTSYCDQITNSFSMELCITGKIDPSSCNQISDPRGQQACLFISAIYSSDTSQCLDLPSTSMQDNCYLQVASNKKDDKVCALISSADLKSQCLQIVRQT
jgi:hypothetical protein